MDNASISIILIGGICLVMGFIASLLLNSTREYESQDNLEEEAPPGGKKGRYISVVKLWRDKKSGALLIEVEGKTLLGSNALSENQRIQLEQAARDLRSWLGMGLSVVSPAITPQLEQLDRPASNETEIASNGQINERIDQAISPPNQSTTRLTNNSVVKSQESGKTITSENLFPQAEKSIVMQIEDILQDLITGSQYERIGVHLLEDPIKGVIVTVGNERFEGIDSVTNPEVKKILRSAVNAWEQK